MLKEGDKVPAFELKAHTGDVITLDSLREAGPFVIYFYPADFTPG